MSFGGSNYFLQNNNNSGGGVAPRTASAAAHMLSSSQSLSESMFNSPGLFLSLSDHIIDAQGDQTARMLLMSENFESSSSGHGGLRKSREELDQEQAESTRSGSDNMDGAGSGDDNDLNRSRKKRYRRHTPQQIQELESLFKECPHPDDKQRLELSRRLCLETRQVKFWFQNRRTQMKTQLERHEKTLLRQENDKLRAENMSIREAIRNPICSNCGGPAILGEISLEAQHLRVENARLKDELEHVCGLAGNFMGRLVPSMDHTNSIMTSTPPSLPTSCLELGVGNNGGGLTMGLTIPYVGHEFGGGLPNNLTGTIDRSVERSMYLELALAAMDELVKMSQTDEPLWIRGLEGASSGREVLNHEEYSRTFSNSWFTSNGLMKRNVNFVMEGSRENGMVVIDSLTLVETLMDSNRWAEMFPCMIARTRTIDVISSGMGGTRNGALQLMHAELQVLSPLVPVREVNFLRFCKQHAEGVWAVVDVSLDHTAPMIRDQTNYCRRLPSGCLAQDMPNGYSKVRWIEHAEYDETQVHRLYRPLISSGMGFGAQRWVATLQRQCQCLAILLSSASPTRDHTSPKTAAGGRSMLKLAQRMTNNFCAGVSASTVHKWNKLVNSGASIDPDVRIMTRKSVDDPGEPPGIVLSAATSVWLPVYPKRLFDFLRDERLRSEWDILSNGGPMQEMAHIAKGQDPGNCVSLLRASAMNSNQSCMLILQETCIDAAGSLVVYAPVDIPAMHVVMNGGDSAYVALLPSGFAIVPDGPVVRGRGGSPKGHGNWPGSDKVGGSLLTVAFQILVNSLPTAKLTVESVETVNNLITCTVQKIKAALQCGKS